MTSPAPVPAPTATNWGYEESVGGDRNSGSWEYRVWVYWSNSEVTSKTVSIPRPESGPDVNVNAKVWAVIHDLIREGTTFRHPDADLPTNPDLPDSSGPAPYGAPEPPLRDPDDPFGPEPESRRGENDAPPGGWFRP